jgi:L-lactate dehydrogenase complex protein LldF
MTTTSTKSDYLRHTHHEFVEASQEALENPKLQRILGQLGDTLGLRNRQAWALLPGSDDVRERARALKDQTLADLDRHLATLERSVLARGGHVYWADDGDQAKRLVLEILQARAARCVVKSKSMTSEEIHLNEALHSAGIEVVETDFGEYIIQLAGHRPSHIVGPALHLTVHEIAEILSVPAGRRLPPHRQTLAAFARHALRQKFAQADAAITGVNFAIAETGSLVLVTNEGNGRLATALPRVHIAIMGMEKVIPRLSDLPVFLKVLARAATGQKLSVYTSIITGPRRAGELDGPEEVHLIILDNGRSKILGGPLRESLFCIRCGACLNACPVYRSIGGHAYGGVYAGPIGAVLTPLYDGLEANRHLPHASSLCGACQAACPVKIQIPQMLLTLRQQLVESPTSKVQRPMSDGGGGPRDFGLATLRRGWDLERLSYRLWAAILKRPLWYRVATWLASRTFGWWHRRDPWVRRLPAKLRGWTEKRDFPAPAAERFRDWWILEGKGEQP